MYINVTGPGDYTIPSNFADVSIRETDSNKRTAPSYSLAPKTKQPYWPQYEVDFKGHDSPGMTSYHPKFDSTNEHIPVFSISKSTRFEGIEERNRTNLQNVPSQYANQNFIDDKLAGFSMSTGKKWTLKMSKEDETTPGPAYDTQYLRSMTHKVDHTD